jgi:hypothetical protein
VVGTCTSDEQASWKDGLNESHWMLRRQCDAAAATRGGACTLISNYATDDALSVCDGGMIERFGCSVDNIDSMIQMGKAGQLVQTHAQVGA